MAVILERKEGKKEERRGGMKRERVEGRKAVRKGGIKGGIKEGRE